MGTISTLQLPRVPAPPERAMGIQRLHYTHPLVPTSHPLGLSLQPPRATQGAAETIPLNAFLSTQVCSQITDLSFQKDLFQRANPNSTGKQVTWAGEALSWSSFHSSGKLEHSIPSSLSTHPISPTTVYASVTLPCRPQPLSLSLPSRAFSTGVRRVRRSLLGIRMC